MFVLIKRGIFVVFLLPDSESLSCLGDALLDLYNTTFTIVLGNYDVLYHAPDVMRPCVLLFYAFHGLFIHDVVIGGYSSTFRQILFV